MKIDVEQVVRKFLSEKIGDLNGKTIGVGVSGGKDSMCLLSCFNEISRQMGFNVISLHLNHQIRGNEADEDENFVREFCRKRNIKFISKSVDVPKKAHDEGKSTELAGREARYEFFSETENVDYIATAHNLDDRLETFILNFTRGTSLKGLTSIREVNGNIIRPLLSVSSEQIVEYDNENSIPFRTDSTNLTDDYTRNLIRHSCIPVLEKINPSLLDTFSNTLSLLQTDEDFIEGICENAFLNAKSEKYDAFLVSEISKSNTAIIRRAVKKIFEYYGARDVESRHIVLFSENIGKKFAVQLSSDLTVETDGEYIWKRENSWTETVEITPNLDRYEVGGRVVEFVDFDGEIPDNIRTASQMCLCDRESLNGAVIRTKRDGDRFCPKGSSSRKMLKKMYAECSVPSFLRSSGLLIASGSDVLFAENVGTAAAAFPDNSDRKKIKITVKREN